MSEAIEVRAQEMGWTPKEQFKGDPEKWVDATTYVERGEQVLPILRKTNQDLHTKLTQANTQLAELTEKLESTSTVVEDLKKFHTEQMADRVKNARASLIRELAEARKEGDVDREVVLTGELEDLRTAEVQAKREEPQKKELPKKDAVDPVTAAWASENEWFGKDEERTAFAMGAAEKLRKTGLLGRPLLDKVAERVREMFEAGVRREFVDRTEGTRHSGSSASGGNGGDYGSLPADARAQCDKDAARFVGKPGFPDEAAWRKHFVQQYNAGA